MAVRIKICGLTRAEDAAAAARLGADAVGLVFYGGSPRCVDAAAARAVVRTLPPLVGAVGLFVNEGAERIRSLLRDVPLDVLQFHGDESADFCRQFDRPYLKAVRVRSREDILTAAERFPDARALLLDAFVEGCYGGTGRSFDHGLLPPDLPVPWILAGGLTPENVAVALAGSGAAAVDVSGGVECAPGVKDVAKMAAFVRAVRATEQPAA